MKNTTATTYESHMRRLAISTLSIFNFLTISFAIFPSLKIIILSGTAVFIITSVVSLVTSFEVTLLEIIAIALPIKYKRVKAVILVSTICAIIYTCANTAFCEGHTFIFSCSFALFSLLILYAYNKQVEQERENQTENGSEIV